MTTAYVDPRVIRTKKLLMDAFREIAKEKRYNRSQLRTLQNVQLLIAQHFMPISMINMTLWIIHSQKLY